MYSYDVETDEFSQIENFSRDEQFSDSLTLANKYNGLIEVTRKGNLEQPILYLMITTLGGTMIDKEGRSIGNYDFKTWGQEERLFLITAKNKSIADGILKSIHI